MSPQIAIEYRGADSVDVVRDLWLSLHHHHHSLQGNVPLVDDMNASWERRRALYRHWLETGRGVLVIARCGHDGVAVGYAFVCIEDGPDDTFAVGERLAELYSLSVAEHARGRGIGTLLLDAVDALLTERGIVDLKVAVMVKNEHARRLYERRGLVAAETVLYRLGG